MKYIAILLLISSTFAECLDSKTTLLNETCDGTDTLYNNSNSDELTMAYYSRVENTKVSTLDSIKSDECDHTWEQCLLHLNDKSNNT